MDPLIPPSIQRLADAAGLTWDEYVNTLSAADRADAEDQIRVYSELRPEQTARQNKNNFINSTIAGPLPEVAMPVLSTGAAVEPSQDPLLTHPTFVSIAQSQNKTPQEYLDSLSPIMLENSRKILLGVEPEIQPQPAAQTPVLQTAVDPTSRAGEEPGVLTRNEQNLVQENIGERQLLEGRIADLEGSVDTQADVARLQQMKQRLVELGGSVKSNQSTPQYDAAAKAYLEQLRGQQAQAAAVAPDVRAAEAELASTTGLLSSGTLPPEMMASVQARQAAAEAALVSGNAARDARVAEANGRTLSVENPVNGLTAQSLGVQLPGQEPGMNGASDYTRPPPVPVDNSGMPSGLGPYTVPTPPTPILAGNEPGMNGPSDYSKPVLINTTTPTPTTAANTQTNAAPVLGTKSSTATRAPALSRGAGNMTANARGSALGITPRGESLIRIGGAMYSGALQGDGLGAATREYGSIQDANRKAEVDAYNKAEATRIAELRAKGKGSKSDAKADAKAQAAANHAAIKLRDVDAALKGLDDYDGVVGIGYWFNKGWDLLTDNERATIRQKIARVKVDATLSNTAFTKGAISDREMRIFQSDQPGWMEGENAWRTYLNEYRDALLIMNSNLASGATPYAASNKSGTDAPSNDSLSDEDLSYIN